MDYTAKAREGRIAALEARTAKGSNSRSAYDQKPVFKTCRSATRNAVWLG